MRPVPEKTLADLQWQQILQALAQRAKTDLGKARGLGRAFLDSAAQVKEELARVDELVRLQVEEQLTLPIWGVRDVRPLLDRAAKGGTLEPSELTGCANVLQSLGRTKEFVESRAGRMPRAAAIGSVIVDLGKLASRIERSFDSAGVLADHASPTLRDLRERARGLHRSIKAKLDQMLHDEGFTPLLREGYYTIRNDRYVVPVLASARSQVPGIVHNASQSGQTLFVEPQVLIGMGNELAIAQSMVVEEERRILQELSGLLGEHAESIGASLVAAAELDALEAAARLSLDLQALAPEPVAPDAPFSLKAMRHPLLALQEKKVVPNDVSLAEGERVLVVSGPNAGGKTVTLTGVGLCSLMLRAGLPIPAEQGSTLPLFEDVVSAVGDDQDLARDLSTFSAHLVSLRTILETARPGTLALVDEIAADTDPREGAAIAMAVLEELVERGARVMVTTHLEELKAVAVTNPRYVNARVGFDSQKMAPTYRLQFGSPGSSSAIEIARRMGLPASLCARAEENLKTAAGPLGQALTALEKERAALETTRRTLEEERAGFAREREEIASAWEAVRERERAIEAEARRDLVAEVEKSRAEVATLLATLQAKPTVREAVEAQAELARRAEQEKKKLETADTAAAAADERLPHGTALAPGMRVRVPGLGDATLLDVDGDEAVVAAGPMKVRRKVAELVPLRGQAKKAAGFPGGKKREERLKAAEKAAGGALEAGAVQVDVRGMRADEALRAVETFLDRCYGEGKTSVVILHGLGTGALRGSIRDYLKGSPYVRHFRSGEDHEGAGGVTIVELRG